MGDKSSPRERPLADADTGNAGEKRARTQESDFQKHETWLKDQERGRDTADFFALLKQAIGELAGQPEMFGRSGVYIRGDVYNSGEIFGGDKDTTHGRQTFLGEVVVGRVPKEILQGIRQSFVRPACFLRLRAMLEKHSVVLLQAPSGWGRTTTALRLLDDLCTGEVRKLNPDTNLRKLDIRKKLQQPGGYLLEVRAIDPLAGLKIPHLEDLSEACAEKGVRLVVTVDEDIPLDGGVRTDYRVTGGDRPDLNAVLHRHLLAVLGEDDAGDRVGRLLADVDVRALLEVVLEDSLSMRRLVELADKLSLVALTSLEVSAVRTYFGKQSEENFSQWFETLEDSRERAFVIALAVLNGMSYFAVARTSGDLYARIREVEIGDEDPGRPVFGTRRQERVDRARAELATATNRSRYGTTRVEAVRFRNDGYPRRVLEWVWREYDELRPLLLDWLHQLGLDGDQAVRIRAAAAVGLLATFDFDRIRRDILLDWASDNNQLARESAVSALCMPSSLRPELTVHVNRMVEDWTRRKNGVNRQWTAARALGTSVGQSILSRAIRLLARIAGREDPGLSFAVADSMIELFLSSEEKAPRAVLAALERWTSDSAPPLRRDTGIFCFVSLTFSVSAVHPETEIPWPGLLWLATQDDAHFDLVALLWRRAIRQPGLFRLAQDAFTEWVDSADRTPAQVDALGRLLDHVVENAYDATRFTQAIKDYEDDHHESAATRSLLATINEKV